MTEKKKISLSEMKKKRVYKPAKTRQPKSAKNPKGSGRPIQFTKEMVEKAIRDNQGKLYLAAKKLGVHYSTFFDYRKRWPELEEVIKECRGKLLDTAESKLYDAIDRGEAWAICCVSGTRITVANGGSVPIQSLRPGHMVMTHTGRIMPIERVMLRKHRGYIYSIRVAGLPIPLRVTGEHPVYAMVRRGPQMVCRNRPLVGPDFVPACELRIGDCVHTPTPNFGTSDIDFSEDLAFVLGIYAAEGRADRLDDPTEEWEIKPGVRMKRKPFGERGGKIEFSLHPIKDALLRDAITNYADTLPGSRLYVYPHSQTPNCEMVVISHRTFARFCAKHVGVGSSTKQLSRELMASSPAILRRFLAGYFAGDGCISGRRDGSREHRLSACTASRNMAEQLFWMLDRIGVVANLTTGMNNGGPNNRDAKNPKWVLNISPRECGKMVDILGQSFTPRDNRSGSRYASAACSYGRIRSIERIPYHGLVYNLHVYGDESYVADMHSVHNCFFLKTQGKGRKYTERQEHKHSGDRKNPLIPPDQGIDVDKLPLALRKQLLEHIEGKDTSNAKDGTEVHSNGTSQPGSDMSVRD